MVNQEESEVITITDTSKLSEDISSLYLNQKFSDITLILDGQKFHAHKVILAVRSEYFEALLYEGSQDSKQTELHISDVSVEAFRKLLKYIYTGTITISSNIELTLDLLGLAHQYSITNLESATVKKTKSSLNQKNICAILNTANLYDLEDLREACHSFMDQNAPEIVTNDCFVDLSQKSLIKLLQRDTFFAPEIDIFKSVAKWCNVNNDVDDLVIQGVRLSWLTVVDIVSIVWPSKLVENDTLLHSIAEIVDVKPKTTRCRAQLVKDENLATPERKAQVLSGINTTELLTGNRRLEKFAYHIIDCQSNIIIKLNGPSYFNNVNFMLWDQDLRSYSYYIEVSLDQVKWNKIIDYSHYLCRSNQNLYFDKQIAQYIKIVGTHNTANKEFHLIFAEVYFKNTIPKVVNEIICPSTNVATIDKKAVVIQGDDPSFLLNGDFKNYTGTTGFTVHVIGSNPIIVQLAQPYMISSMKLLLWDQDGRSYRYFIETSVNKSDWEIAVDRRNQDCKSWQNHQFKERPVVFVKLTGTHNTVNTGFHLVHFECPSSDR